MHLEEIAFCFQSGIDRFGSIDIPLSAVHDWYVTKSERNDAACKNVDDIRPLIPGHIIRSLAYESKPSNVHQVNFGENTDRPSPFWIYLTS